MKDQFAALELGAADCLIKPFNVRKLVLQIRNLLRSIAPEELKVGDLSLDRSRHEVRAANSIVQCTPKEFILLGLLMERLLFASEARTVRSVHRDYSEYRMSVGSARSDRCVVR
jgi:DNA-binding response OmpR family regulator